MNPATHGCENLKTKSKTLSNFNDYFGVRYAVGKNRQKVA